jgi:hypothetical protein
MANKAKPEYLKRLELRLLKEKLILRTLDEYHNQDAKPGSREWLGYRQITNKIMDDYERETITKSNPRGVRVDLNWNTVRKRDDGTKSLIDTRADDGILTPEEDRILTEFLQEAADRGFPANNKRIVEAALAIIQKRNPSIKSLSTRWVARFILRKKAQGELQKYWSKSLKSDRGRAVNKNTHNEYFNLLERVFKEKDFSPDCIYGGDESGFQKGRNL